MEKEADMKEYGTMDYTSSLLSCKLHEGDKAIISFFLKRRLT